MTEHIASTQRYKRLTQRRTPAGGRQSVNHRDNSFRDSDIETSAAKQWNETNLPGWLMPYVQNRSWAIRFANLLNQGYFHQLQHLAGHIPRVAHTNPVHMMAVACSKARWDETLTQVRERLKVERLGTEVIRRLRTTADQSRAVYAAVWRYKDKALHFAATAVEIGRDKFRFFCWLCSANCAGAGRRPQWSGRH